MTIIGPYSFQDAANLKSITIPSSVTTINGTEVFYDCTNLATVYIDSSSVAALLSSRAAAGYLIQNATTVYVSENAALSLPEEFSIIFRQTSSDQGGYRKYTAAWLNAQYLYAQILLFEK